MEGAPAEFTDCKYGASCTYLATGRCHFRHTEKDIKRSRETQKIHEANRPLSNKEQKLIMVREARKALKKRRWDRQNEHIHAVSNPFVRVMDGLEKLTVGGVEAVITYTNQPHAVDSIPFLIPLMPWISSRFRQVLEYIVPGFLFEVNHTSFCGSHDVTRNVL